MMKRIAAVLLTAVVLLAMAVPVFAQQEMVTICHAAGQEGTLQFVTLTIPYNAAYGQAGHFNEDGTPQAGHEHDYEGPCIEDTTTTTTSTSSTTSSTSTSSTTSTTTSTTTSSTTTTVTTTPTSSTTTSTDPSTTTTLVPSTSTSTSTTVPLTTPTTLPFTGIDSGVAVGLGSSLLAGGMMLLLALRARHE